jgi:hypothetical protein
MNLKLKLLRPSCPVCHAEDKVYVYDHGFKFWRRLVVGNNRFACRNCMVTWRRKKPDHQTRLQKREDKAIHTQSARSPNITYLVFWAQLKKNFWTYCFIAVFSAVSAYIIIGFFPHPSMKAAFRQRVEIQNTGNKNVTAPAPRNDKMSGALELQKRANGK